MSHCTDTLWSMLHSNSNCIHCGYKRTKTVINPKGPLSSASYFWKLFFFKQTVFVCVLLTWMNSTWMDSFSNAMLLSHTEYRVFLLFVHLKPELLMKSCGWFYNWIQWLLNETLGCFFVSYLVNDHNYGGYCIVMYLESHNCDNGWKVCKNPIKRSELSSCPAKCLFILWSLAHAFDFICVFKLDQNLHWFLKK